MEKSFLEELKEEYQFEHKNSRVSFNDDLCFMSIASEYSNKHNFEFKDDRRLLLEDFAEFLELYLETCDGNGEF
jgi:hypothetical protein